MFLSGALVGVATLIRQPSAVILGAMLACLAYGWLISRIHSFARVFAAGTGILIGFIAVIAALAWYYQWQGNLHDAYLWAWAFAIRYVEFETTFLYVLKRLVTVHLAVMLAWGLLWYFGVRQVIETLRSFRRRKAVPTEQVLLILWLVLSYLAIFIGWRFPGHYHLAVLPPLSILAGQGVLTLCRGTATFSSTALAMDPSRHYWCGSPAGDRFSRRGLRSANADAQFSSDCSVHRQGDDPE
jgi:hypothetical protein